MATDAEGTVKGCPLGRGKGNGEGLLDEATEVYLERPIGRKAWEPGGGSGVFGPRSRGYGLAQLQA